MVDLKKAIEAKSSSDKAKIAIEAIQESEKIFGTKTDNITKEKLAEMIFPGITVAKTATDLKAISISTLSTTESLDVQKKAPRWVHKLIDFIWDIFS
jgi:hypothetical protein